MLKQILKLKRGGRCVMQPPSGGCVLKPHGCVPARLLSDAATFGWLCVETSNLTFNSVKKLAATFGWLCVETR